MVRQPITHIFRARQSGEEAIENGERLVHHAVN